MNGIGRMDGMDGVDGMDRMDGERIRGFGVLLLAFAAALAGCYRVEHLSLDGGGGDSDTDSDTDFAVLSPGFEEDLDDWDGCGDAFLYGYGAYGAEEVELVFSHEGHALSLYAGDGYQSGEFFDLPDDEVALEVRLGIDMAGDECTDIAPGDGVVWRTYAPVSGEASFWVTTTSEEWSGSEWDIPALADLELIDVVFAPSDGGPGDPVLLDYLFVEEVSVGWFPG